MDKDRYKVKTFRISEEIYKELLEKKKHDGRSWNLFFKRLLKKYGDKEDTKNTR